MSRWSGWDMSRHHAINMGMLLKLSHRLRRNFLWPGLNNIKTWWKTGGGRAVFICYLMKYEKTWNGSNEFAMKFVANIPFVHRMIYGIVRYPRPTPRKITAISWAWIKNEIVFSQTFFIFVNGIIISVWTITPPWILLYLKRKSVLFTWIYQWSHIRFSIQIFYIFLSSGTYVATPYSESHSQ